MSPFYLRLLQGAISGTKMPLSNVKGMKCVSSCTLIGWLLTLQTYYLLSKLRAKLGSWNAMQWPIHINQTKCGGQCLWMVWINYSTNLEHTLFVSKSEKNVWIGCTCTYFAREGFKQRQNEITCCSEVRNYYSEHFSLTRTKAAACISPWFFSYFHYTVKNSTLHKWNYKVHISYWPLFVELWIFWGWATATLKIIVLHDAYAIVPGPSSHFINAFSCPACQWITRGRAFFYVLSVTQSRVL